MRYSRCARSAGTRSTQLQGRPLLYISGEPIERITPHLTLRWCKSPVVEEEGKGGAHSPCCSQPAGPQPGSQTLVGTALASARLRHVVCLGSTRDPAGPTSQAQRMIKPELAETSRGQSHSVNVIQVEMRFWEGWEPCSRLDGQERGESTACH